MRRSRAAPTVHRTTSRGQVERERRRRDRAILQLWRDGWTGKKIAAHLDIMPAIVGNVTHKHGATRHARTSPSNGRNGAPATAWESYRVYFWRVMEGLFRQADEHCGTPPPFVSIPEPADENQREQITQTIEWWARQAFDLPAIEIRIEQDRGRAES